MSKALEEAWDKLTVAVFTGSNRAFYGSLLCSLKIQWDSSIPTAMVNPSLGLKWNPEFFLSLVPETRKFVLMHELEHVARLHELRKGTREHKRWNMACDYEINLAQVQDGLTYTGTSPLISNDYLGMTAEEIYDLLPEDPEGSSWGNDEMDMEEGEATPEQLTGILNTVVKATQAAKVQGCSTNKTTAIEQLLSTFLAPKVDWNKVLRAYMTDKLAKRITWKKPNRRHEDIFLPARVRKDDALREITFYLDTSGSVSDKQIQIFASEVRHIHKHYLPKKLNIVFFDTDICKETTYTRTSNIKDMSIIGRGGTDLRCVHEHMLKTKPDIAVVLSDLQCDVMDTVPCTDVLWVVFDNPHATVNQGKTCHVKTY